MIRKLALLAATAALAVGAPVAAQAATTGHTVHPWPGVSTPVQTAASGCYATYQGVGVSTVYVLNRYTRTVTIEPAMHTRITPYESIIAYCYA